jgi:hypothetical protein
MKQKASIFCDHPAFEALPPLREASAKWPLYAWDYDPQSQWLSPRAPVSPSFGTLAAGFTDAGFTDNGPARGTLFFADRSHRPVELQASKQFIEPGNRAHLVWHLPNPPYSRPDIGGNPFETSSGFTFESNSC